MRTALRGKRLVVAVVLVVAALAAIGPAAGSQAKKHDDRVTGQGQRTAWSSPGAYLPVFTIDARSGPSGSKANGTMTIDWGTTWVDSPIFGKPYRTDVKVTNLCVTGNTATIVGIITSSTARVPNMTDVGEPIVTIVRDGGKGGKLDGLGGVYSGSPWLPDYWPDDPVSGTRQTPDYVCQNPPFQIMEIHPLIWGNIKVNDAT